MPERIDLRLLAGPLPVSAAPGLAGDDPDLHDVTSRFVRGDYAEAAQGAAAVFQRRVYDVRLLPAFFVGAFLDGGVAGLSDTLRALLPVLGDELRAFGPTARKVELCDGALAALFRTVLQLLEYHDAQRDTVWTDWVLASDEEQVDAIVNVCAAVGDSARKALGGGAPDAISRLRAWIDVSFRGVVARHSMLPELAPPPSAPAPASKPAAPAATRKPTRPPPPAPPPPSAPAPAAAPDDAPAKLAPVPDKLEVAVSPALQLLLQKLQAFAILVDRGELQKAAVVARDLEKVLAAFDPKVYLPALLSPYFARLSAHVDDLAPYLDAPEGRAWQVLESFYQVDLDAFVREPGR
jgi:hypothetical protein